MTDSWIFCLLRLFADSIDLVTFEIERKVLAWILGNKDLIISGWSTRFNTITRFTSTSSLTKNEKS